MIDLWVFVSRCGSKMLKYCTYINVKVACLTYFQDGTINATTKVGVAETGLAVPYSRPQPKTPLFNCIVDSKRR